MSYKKIIYKYKKIWNSKDENAIPEIKNSVDFVKSILAEDRISELKDKFISRPFHYVPYFSLCFNSGIFFLNHNKDKARENEAEEYLKK